MRVKICGITRREDAIAAAEEGASALGFIFVPGSPRRIEPVEAAGIVRSLPPFVCPVGVFADATREVILRTIAATGIRCLQLHGEEAPADTEGYPLPVIKSFRVAGDFDPSRMAAYRLPAYLLDSSVPGVLGGTGRTFDWERARAASRFGRIILAGGITPENVARAVRTAGPYAIDVSSGVESSPGVKDRARIRELFTQLRTV